MKALSQVQNEATEVYDVVATLELLPQNKKTARLGILLSVCQRLVSTLDTLPPTTLSHLVSATFLLAAESDYVQLEANVEQIQRAAPSLRLHESSAFTVTTSIWRIAEKAEKDGRFAAAAGWYLLGIEPMFASMGLDLQAKLARRGILALVQAGDTEAAQKFLRSASALQGDLAKNHFVKFYASVNDADQALDAIHDLVRAPDVKPSLLLWAHRVALERGEQKLAGRVLHAVATAFQATPKEQDGGTDINPLVLTRSIIRALLSDMKAAQDLKQRNALLHDITEQTTFAFTTIGARAKDGTASDDLGKELVWLYKTAFNLAAELQHEWDAAASKTMFRLIVDMMSYGCQLGVESDVEMTSKLATCRLAVIRSGLEEARLTTATKDRIVAYRTVLSDAKDFLALPSHADASTVDKVEEKKAAALAVLVEALYELGEWDELLKFAQVKPPTSEFSTERADGSFRVSVVRDRLHATAERAQTARRVLDRHRIELSARDSVQDLAQNARRAVPPARRGPTADGRMAPGHCSQPPAPSRAGRGAQVHRERRALYRPASVNLSIRRSRLDGGDGMGRRDRLLRCRLATLRICVVSSGCHDRSSDEWFTRPAVASGA